MWILRRPRHPFAALCRREIVELLLVIGSYQMLAHAMTALDIDIDEAVGGAVLERSRSRPREGS